MGNALRPAWILFIVTALTGLLLGFVQNLTAEPIRLTRERERAEALRRALPAAESFRPVENGDFPGIVSVEEALAGGDSVGLCVTLDTAGYGGEIRLLVGIGSDGAVTGVEILSHSETPGLGAKAAGEAFRDPLKGMTGPVEVTKQQPRANEVEAISGATITTRAVADGLNRALDVFRQVKGGGVS
ncbi:RnfABCDGE type electron transport complex subunit G [Aminithiophilus ramosus]|uniref:Ion-translocating oxidoreductase complex subunit G n=2 Tax=Synergistales TaxID=649776 RepID=A0A9Q7AQK3_9BACT|nr:RnfABCDGE type electron transport complex subunit G [Aminithiophilus ramosus]QTX32256.1 RnfABCDGE type electron transport complex subunit G [Aminithiophilus ramosus]QVL36124.1 RnfABCDGE type electron transport complex subunit G [Synergistota bacterium]